jgi:hypothetical protein
MESLVLAIVAVQNLYGPQEPALPETETFHPFDFQSLRYVYGAKESSANRPTDRNDSHLAQVVS